jgi:site-specific recombinase XerC
MTGLEDDVAPHHLRHTYTSMVLADRVNLAKVIERFVWSNLIFYCSY